MLAAVESPSGRSRCAGSYDAAIDVDLSVKDGGSPEEVVQDDDEILSQGATDAVNRFHGPQHGAIG